MGKSRKNLQTTLLESLSNHIRRTEEFEEQFKGKEIIISTDYEVAPYLENSGVVKTPIVWQMIDYHMFYIVDVPPNTTLPKHSHSESIFRVLISGSLTINGKTIDKPGTWYVVPAYTEYTITTQEGYMILSGYKSHCNTSRQEAKRKHKRSK